MLGLSNRHILKEAKNFQTFFVNDLWILKKIFSIDKKINRCKIKYFLYEKEAVQNLTKILILGKK